MALKKNCDVAEPAALVQAINHVLAIFDRLGVENRPPAFVLARVAGLGGRHLPQPGARSQPGAGRHRQVGTGFP